MPESGSWVCQSISNLIVMITDAKIAMNLRKWKAETVTQWSFLLIHTKLFVSFFDKQLLQSLFKQKCQTFSFWVERKHLVIFEGFAEKLAPWG